MMKFYIFILQKNRDTLYVQAMEEYLKRLGKYCTIEVKYVKKEKQLGRIFEKEGKHFLVTSSENSMESTAFAEEISRWMLDGCSNIFFYIGGFSREHPVSEFSVSSFDMAPELCAAVLLEQIYRGYRIMNCQPYHK